jgi:ZIP family zinc transporter
MRNALLAAALTGLATGLGAFPFFFVRALPRRVYDGILGLGAGLMLAAATLGLLTEALAGVHAADGLDTGRLLLVIAGFVSGVGMAAVMDRFIPHRHARGHRQHIVGHDPDHDHGDAHEHVHGNGHDHGGEVAQEDLRRTYLIIGALSIHRVPEGLAIGAGFVASESHRLGLMLSVAVALQNACEGVVMGAPLRRAGVSPMRGLLIVLLTGSAVPFGALVGNVVSASAVAALPFVLALAAGTLIYVTSNEIIPESHSHGHEGTASAGVVAGFLVTMLIGAVLR